MAKLPPEGSSTVVSARRTARAGIVRPGVVTGLPLASTLVPPASVNAPVLVSSLTSVEICSEMRFWLSTTGVKERPTPNCLNCTDTLPC